MKEVLLSEPFPRRSDLFSISTLNHYLYKLVLKFHRYIKVFGVVTSNQKRYVTFALIQVHQNEILPLNSEDSKQSRLKFYTLVEMSALMRSCRHEHVSQDNCGKVAPCTKADYLLPPVPTKAGLGRQAWPEPKHGSTQGSGWEDLLTREATTSPRGQ